MTTQPSDAGAALDGAGRQYDQIRLVGISATGYHGVFDHERRDGQVFRADVIVHLDTRRAAASDDLTLTVDYGTLGSQVAAVLAGDPVDLVETLAERIAATALAHRGVEVVDVVVHKPQAPLTVPFEDIVVAIRRDRTTVPATPAWTPTTTDQAWIPPVRTPSAVAWTHTSGQSVPRDPAEAPAPITEPADESDDAAFGFATVFAAVSAAAPSSPPASPLASPFERPPAAVELPMPSDDVEPVVAESALAEPSLAETALAEPSLTEPSRAEPALTEPVQAEPVRAESASAGPDRVEMDRLEVAPPAQVQVVLSLGSNRGAAQDTLRAAVADLAALDGIEIDAVSPLARTSPVGGPEQPDFLNAIVIASTTLAPMALLRATQAIETAHGRVRHERWGPRTLDIDLIVYGTTLAVTEDLELPHPRAHERAFVLQPWVEIAPDAVLPGLGGGPVAALAATAPDREGIRWLALDWLDAPSSAPGPDATAPRAHAHTAEPRTGEVPVVPEPSTGDGATSDLITRDVPMVDAGDRLPAEPLPAEPISAAPPTAAPPTAAPPMAAPPMAAPPMAAPPAAEAPPVKAPPAVDFAELLNRDLPAPPTLDRADPLAGHLSARLGPTAGSVQPVPDRPAAPNWHLTDSPPPAEPAAGERPS